MTKPVISVEKLSKAYRIGLKEEIPDTLMGAVTGVLKAPLRNWRRLRRLDTFQKSVLSGQLSMASGHESEENGEGLALDPGLSTLDPTNGQRTTDNADAEADTIWALKDVSFEVHEGEVVGIIGRNGAGKSTLLKILSRITEPTSGRAVIRGRVSSLLEVGTGFHPELTGRENIYMNGTILGMTKREIDRKFDEIVDFSGVEKFLDTPVKRYSSGMKVRLAFAVAAHLDPEILIIDEVLAVGDVEFQKRCLGKMHDVARSGRTVLFVSHNMPAVRSLTSRAALLRSGELTMIGHTAETIDRYLDDSVAQSGHAGAEGLEYYRRNPNTSSPVRFSRVWVEGHDSRIGTLARIASGDDILLGFELEARERVASACLAVTVFKEHEQSVVTLFSPDAGFPLSIDPGKQSIRCHISGLPLTPGRYAVSAGINRNANANAFDVLVEFPLFEVDFREADSGHIDWTDRPWGAIHWRDVEWSKS